MGKAFVVSGDTKVTCLNATGKEISLPVDYLYRAIADGRKITKLDGSPLTISACGAVDMMTMATNYTSWHRLTLGADARLALWDGGSIAVRDAKGAQLAGERGMYCVTSVAHLTVDGFMGEFENVGGVYVRD